MGRCHNLWRWLPLLSAGLSACSSPGIPGEKLAQAGHLVREQVATVPFLLTAYGRQSRPDRPLRIYIEGDGKAWINRHTPSLDPTPEDPVGLALAAADPGPNVLYLARPCQYTPRDRDPACTTAYWTGKRFAPEVIASLNQAIDHFVARTPGQDIELVGYSGGGAVAALLAARRQDVLSLRTVAGNLDTEAVNRLHRVSPMPDSLNPIAVAARLRRLPQWHFSGGADRIVPPPIAAAFAAAVGGSCVHLSIQPGMSHNGDWAQIWPALLAKTPTCTP